MILHISCIILRVFRFCGQGVWYPRKRRKSETINEVRSLIIVVRGSQTWLRKEEWWHHKKGGNVEKLDIREDWGHLTLKKERLTPREEQVWHQWGRKESHHRGERESASERKERVLHRGKSELASEGRRECHHWGRKRGVWQHRGVTELDITEVRGNVVSCRKEGVWYQRLRRESGITENGRNHHRDKREADITEERNKKYRKKQEIFSNGEWSLILKVRGRLVSQRGRSLASQRLEEVSHHGGRSTLSFMLFLLLGAMILI